MIEIEKGEGTIRIKKIGDGIQISYGCIDDFAFITLTSDDIMEMLGYKKRNTIQGGLETCFHLG